MKVDILQKELIERTYGQNTIDYYEKKAYHELNLIRSNNIGTRDQHLQIIIDQLIDLNIFLVKRLKCIAYTQHVHGEIELW